MQKERKIWDLGYERVPISGAFKSNVSLILLQQNEMKGGCIVCYTRDLKQWYWMKWAMMMLIAKNMWFWLLFFFRHLLFEEKQNRKTFDTKKIKKSKNKLFLFLSGTDIVYLCKNADVLQRQTSERCWLNVKLKLKRRRTC